MIFLLLMQLVLLPLLLSLIVLLAANQFKGLRRFVDFFHIAIWLISYAWILNWPNVPPRSFQDWLWIIALAAGLITSLSSHGWIKAGFTITSCCLLIWPVIASQLNWQLASEFFVLSAATAIIFFRKSTLDKPVNYFSFCFWLGCLGVLTIMSGSSSIGFLCIALAFSQGASALANFKIECNFEKPIALIMAILLLSIIRIYVEMHLAAWLCFIAALLIINLTKMPGAIWLISAIGLIAISATIIVYIEFFRSATSSYY